jgi:hypothetical protein
MMDLLWLVARRAAQARWQEAWRSMDGGTKPNSLKTQDRRGKGEWLAE